MRALAILLIGLGVGGTVGFVLGQTGEDQVDAPSAMEHAGHTHMHGEALMIEAGAEAPTLALSLAPDTVAGWNLNIQTSNFRFSAERAGAAHVDGEGHAHIYVNGEKVARAYGAWFHIEDMPTGRVEIEVTLNSNDHRALMVGESPLSATVTFDNPG